MDRSYLEERESFIRETTSLIDQGKLDQAKDMALGRCSRYPGDDDGWLVQAACAVRTGRFDEALAVMRNLDKVLPGWPRISECIGDVCRESGKTDQALAAYRDALRPDGPLGRRVSTKLADISAGSGTGLSPYSHTLALVDACRRDGSLERALGILRSLLQDDPLNGKLAALIREIEDEESERTRALIHELGRWLNQLEGARRDHG